MADEVDRANDLAEDHREQLARLAAAQAATRVQARGFCLYCGEPQPPPKLYCDAGCAQDHALQQAAARRAHGRR